MRALRRKSNDSSRKSWVPLESQDYDAAHDALRLRGARRSRHVRQRTHRHTAEQMHGGGGLLNGRALALVFQSLRANELIWPYVTGNYLKGQTPSAFDLLYWN